MNDHFLSHSKTQNMVSKVLRVLRDERAVLAIFTVLAFWTRFRSISHPMEVVFDGVHIKHFFVF